MVGTVYLRTNRFEVQIEGIAFKARDFEALCSMDFLFPEGKDLTHRPIVGIDVMSHPRDPKTILMLLCFGVGCIILRFPVGEQLRGSIRKFLTDKRIHFVGFGIPEKEDLFPFEALGLLKNKVDVGYLATKFCNDSKYKKCDLACLASKVLGINRMVGITEASSFERHEQIKSAICQLFVSNLIAMTILGHDQRRRRKEEGNALPKKNSFLKSLNSMALLNEGWSKLHKVSLLNEGRFKMNNAKKDNNTPPNVEIIDDDEGMSKGKKENKKFQGGQSVNYDSGKGVVCETKKPLRGILKCPSTGLEGCDEASPATFKEQESSRGPNLKRANSKGFNVSFK